MLLANRMSNELNLASNLIYHLVNALYKFNLSINFKIKYVYLDIIFCLIK